MGPWHSDWTEAEHAKFIRIHPNKKKHHGLFWHTSVDPQLHLKDKDYWILEEQMVLIDYLKKYLKKFPCFNSCQLLPEQELSNSMDRCGQVAAIACPSKCWPKKTPKTKWSSRKSVKMPSSQAQKNDGFPSRVIHFQWAPLSQTKASGRKDDNRQELMEFLCQAARGVLKQHIGEFTNLLGWDPTV